MVVSVFVLHGRRDIAVVLTASVAIWISALVSILSENGN